MTLTGESMDSQDLALSVLTEATAKEWIAYVQVALHTPPAAVGARAQELSDKLHIGKDSIHRRLAAIQFALGNKLTISQVIEAGQEATLSAHIRAKKTENAGKTVKIGYQIPGELKQMFDAEMARARRVANLVTPEQYFEWLVSVLHGLSDDDILNLAGGKGSA